MTAREKFNRTRHRIGYVSLVGSLVAITAVTIIMANNAMNALPFFALGMLIAFIGFAYGMCFGYRCPHCDYSCHAMCVFSGKQMFRVNPHFQFCPFCGTDIDMEVSVTDEAGTASSV